VIPQGRGEFVRNRWRKGWDSNPRGSVNPLPVFKTGALNHSATLPTPAFVQLFRLDPLPISAIITEMVTKYRVEPFGGIELNSLDNMGVDIDRD
jgi:hypothetical protein